MIDFGIVRPGTTLYIPFATYDSNDPSASVTLTGLATTDIEVYKDGSVTQRASDAGYALLDTDGIDFDAVTGIHGISIDLADNTTAGFWAAGSQYFVVVSSVTVDAATINFIAARFTIGYPNAAINTTIATLSTQTSFTLTAGPAEDDALNGWIAVIHDVASAVQCGHAVVQDYTGASKTVTLTAGTTFTAAATDNISFFPPANAQYGGTVAYSATRGLAGTALPAAAADAAGGLPISDAGGLDLDAKLANTNEVTAARMGALTDWIDGGRLDLLLDAIKAVTDALPNAGALTDLATAANLATVAGYLDTEVAAILAAVDTEIATLISRTDGMIIASGTIGATGNDTTHVHLSGLAYADDGINSLLLVLKDVSTGLYYSRWVEDFANTGDLATVATLPVTPEASVDLYWVLPIRADVTGGSGLDAAGVRAALGMASANLDTQLAAIDDAVDTEVAAVKAKTDNLPSDPADQSAVEAAISAAQTAILAKLPAALTADGNIKADTLRVGGTLQTAGDLAALLATIDDFLDTEIAAIKAKTDNLPTDPADESALEAVIATAQADLTTLLARLTALRAGYLDNLSAGAVAQASALSTAQTAITAIQAITDALGATAAAKLAQSCSDAGMPTGNAITGTLSTTQFSTDLTEATNDHYNGRTVIFLTGVLAGQGSDITAYNGTTKVITVTAMTEAPSNGDDFIIV